ncbi:MAG: DNA/RNA nuclease SfsA [bacterium]
MILPQPLIPGKFIRRYKRFFADIELDSGDVVIAHCPNPGSMLGLLDIGSPVLISTHDDPRRKLAYSWQLIKVQNTWVGINTAITNRIVQEALHGDKIAQLCGYREIKPEVAWGEHTRFDFLLKKGNELCFVEVKNTTLAEKKVALFPDAITKRGTKHLNELIEVVNQGHRAVMFFLVNREDCEVFKPASGIDPLYAETLCQARENGVEILVYMSKIMPPEIEIDRSIDLGF